MGSGERAPAGLGGLTSLNAIARAAAGLAGAAGDLGAEFDGGEGRLDGIRRPQVDPVFGREVEYQRDAMVAYADARLS